MVETLVPPVLDYPETLPVAPRSRRQSALVVAALVLSLTGVGLGTVALLRPPTVVHDEHVVSAPTTSAPSYSRDEIAAAKQEVCDAWDVAGTTIRAERKPFLDSPDDPGLLAADEAAVVVQTAYIREHLRAATPPPLAAAINDYIGAYVEVAAADARHDAQKQSAAATRGNVAAGKVRTLCTR